MHGEVFQVMELRKKCEEIVKAVFIESGSKNAQPISDRNCSPISKNDVVATRTSRGALPDDVCQSALQGYEVVGNLLLNEQN